MKASPKIKIQNKLPLNFTGNSELQILLLHTHISIHTNEINHYGERRSNSPGNWTNKSIPIAGKSLTRSWNWMKLNEFPLVYSLPDYVDGWAWIQTILTGQGPINSFLSLESSFYKISERPTGYECFIYHKVEMNIIWATRQAFPECYICRKRSQKKKLVGQLYTQGYISIVGNGNTSMF